MEVLALVGFLALVVGVAYWSYVRKRRRREALFTLATASGWEYSIQDPFGLHRADFDLFRRGDGRGCENVVWGAWKDMPIRAADYWYYEQSSDGKGRTTRTYKHFSIVVADLPVNIPHASIGRENLLSRLADHVGFRDIEFESEEFNRAFQVSCDDRAFAFKLIDARFMQWLLSIDARFGFEANRATLLAYSRRLEPGELITLVGTAKEFEERIPRIVVTEYGVAS